MPCYRPITGYRGPVNPSTGRRPLVFNRREAWAPARAIDRDVSVTIPCGRCIGCRLERSRQWAMRCVHEASLYEQNCFITLTYNEESLPKNRSLVKKHFQDFIRSLRDQLRYLNELHDLKRGFCEYPQKDARIRYFHCGEYGEENGRPHYPLS